jgi:hypothetical protein
VQCVAWLRDIIPAIVGDTMPNSLATIGLRTDPIHVLDLAILLLVMVLSALYTLEFEEFSYFRGEVTEIEYNHSAP